MERSRIDVLLDEQPEVLHVADVAGLFHVAPSTVHTWLRSHQVRGSKIGSSWIIMREDLRAAARAGDNFRQKGELEARDVAEPN